VSADCSSHAREYLEADKVLVENVYERMICSKCLAERRPRFSYHYS
jgi:hypothetical protein